MEYVLEAAQALPGVFGEGDLVLLKGRTTDHIGRLYHAMLAPIQCWKTACPKTMLCDECWELGAAPASEMGAKLEKPDRSHALEDRPRVP